jgi:hypothetical protein
MRVIVPHQKQPAEIIQNIDRRFDEIFRGLPVGPVQIVDMQRSWAGRTMTFAFNASAGFMSIPIKGFVEVGDREVTVDVDLPAFLSQFLPEDKLKPALEKGVKGLLT